MVARILVDIKVNSLNRLFDYRVPKDEEENLQIGMRVIVPFGEQKRMGYVIELIPESEFATKEIIEVLDIIPSISDEAFNYIEVLKKQNDGLLIDIVETILPSELFLKYEQELEIIKMEALSEAIINLFKGKKKVIYSNKWLKKYRNEISNLVRKNAIQITKLYQKSDNEKTEQTIVFIDDSFYKKKEQYHELINFVKDNPGLNRKEIQEQGFSLSSINTLIKNSVFEVIEKTIDRQVNFKNTTTIPEHVLNNEQQLAYQSIVDKLNSDKIFLLHGITGSGKTEVYMHIISDVLKTNKPVLYLVPEISLVAPLMQYLSSRFNCNVTHYNSSLSKGERYDAWQRIINNQAKIIVGTRSSVFLPIDDLGLIIVDEEHDKSYVQTERVQYRTIEMAKIKSKYNNCPIVLGSATPQVSSMFYAKEEKYQLLELKKRATNQPLPKVHYVDMKEELKAGNTKIFSQLLFDKINQALKNNKQIILLYNRRGYASFTMCRVCGYTPKCPKCDISLTYYKNDNELRCNYCGKREPNYETCPSCGNNAIKPVGLGVDQVYELTKKTFPDARVLKMDSESTSKKGKHEEIWLDFKDHKYDILIGTQMVSKGLDFPNVTLVGILMADLELKNPSYLATEEAYALLTQMVGRSGRSMQGEAIIQGYDIDNYAIKSVNEDYESFYKKAIYYREVSNYEPFYNVSQILVKNESYLLAYQDALKLKKVLSNSYNIVLGPAESVVKYIKGEFRFLITIKNQKNFDEKIFTIINKQNLKSKITYLSIPEII